MKKFVCLCALLLSMGCAKAIFRPYVGEQQAWPTAEGSIVNTKYQMPVFTSLPPTPYDVVGELRVESPFYDRPEEGHLPRLIRKASEMGADGLVFVQGQIFFSSNYGPRHGADAATAEGKAPTLTQVNTFNPDSFGQGVTILAIRWIGQPPPGLPAHATAAAPVAEPQPTTPAPAPSAGDATQPAPPVATNAPPVVTAPPATTNTPPAATAPQKPAEATPTKPAPPGEAGSTQ